MSLSPFAMMVDSEAVREIEAAQSESQEQRTKDCPAPAHRLEPLLLFAQHFVIGEENDDRLVAVLPDDFLWRGAAQHIRSTAARHRLFDASAEDGLNLRQGHLIFDLLEVGERHLRPAAAADHADK